MVTHESPPTRLPAIAGSLDTVELEVGLLATPSGVLIIAAGAPNLNPFERIDPLKDDLWIRLEADGRHADMHPRMEFATRRKPYTTDTTPRPIAHSAVISDGGVPVFTVLAVQMVADLLIVQSPPGDNASNEPLHLIAFLESASYDWNRYQALCAQFDAERRSSRRPRNDVGGAMPGRRSRRNFVGRSRTSVSRAAPGRKRSTLGSEFDQI